MTEIEKQAEELVKENVCKKCGSKVCGFLIHKCDIAFPRYEGVLVGLAESRIELEIKEGIIKYWKKLCKDKSNDVIELQKENAELKAHLKAVDDVNEKMKCCENCLQRAPCEWE